MAKQLTIEMTELMKLLPHTPPDLELHAKSIYRVSKILTDFNSQAYKPKIASFGPYHHNCSHLLGMEKHKSRAVEQFYRRIFKASKTPDDVYIAMKKVESKLLASYDSLDKADNGEDHFKQGRFHNLNWLKEKDEFLKIMIMDGCFALEVMLALKRNNAGEKSEYGPLDPLFGTDTKNAYISDFKRDMLLLENQLPLLALTTLAAIEGSWVEDLSTLIKSFYDLSWASPDYQMTDETSLHILDLFRKISTAEGKYLPSFKENAQSATKLKNAGVSFCKSKSKSFRDISFNRGILSLPPRVFDGDTESLLLNLMAFERLHVTAGNEVTAYAFFLNALINTENDVALLRTKEWLGSNSDIANIFIKIINGGTLVVLTDDIEVDVNNKLNTYCKKRMHRWRASFMETYLKNPWVFASLVGGLFLLALTVIQALFSILQYYRA